MLWFSVVGMYVVGSVYYNMFGTFFHLVNRYACEVE